MLISPWGHASSLLSLFACGFDGALGAWERLRDLSDSGGALMPSARAEHAGAWDALSRTLLVQDGSGLVGDLWAYDVEVQAWTRRSGQGHHGPAPRASHGAGWDQAARALWVHGGYGYDGSTTKWYRDVWRHQSGTWTLEAGDGGP